MFYHLFIDRDKLIEEIDEKSDNISTHKTTLEKMKSTILTLRDNLQNTYADVQEKENKITALESKLDKLNSESARNSKDNSLSMMTTINSYLVSSGLKDEENSTGTSKDPDELYEAIIYKIKQIPNLLEKQPEKPADNPNDNSDGKIKELQYQIKDLNEKLENKEKELALTKKQKDTLRSQLGSAVESFNSKDMDSSPNKAGELDVLPSLQTQLQALQDESKQSEVTRDMTEQLIDSFERNDRKLRDKLHKALLKIKELKISRASGSKENPQLKSELTADLKKQIRAEEVEKRNKEIERQRNVMSSKSEQQSILLNQKIEELEARLEAKDDDMTDMLIKIQEAESEIEKLKHSKERRSLLSIDEFEDLSASPTKKGKNNAIDNQMKILEKVEKLDVKIIEVNEKIGAFRNEILERLEDELEEINSSILISIVHEFHLGENTSQKLQKMKDTNQVVQIVRKTETEGLTWLLLEKKEPLNKPLGLKDSHSLSKSSIENQPGGRKLFWVCEEGMKEELLEYIYHFTPGFLLKNESLKLTIPDLFDDDSERKSWKMLKDSTKELFDKRQELLREQREIKLGLRRENFLLGKLTLINLNRRCNDHRNFRKTQGA